MKFAAIASELSDRKTGAHLWRPHLARFKWSGSTGAKSARMRRSLGTSTFVEQELISIVAPG